MSRFIIAALLIASVFCQENYVEKYVSPCPGAISSDSTYHSFLVKSFDKDGDLMKNCKIEYFSDVKSVADSGCKDEHNACVKHVQEFMWDGCHWRLLYDIVNNKEELDTWITKQYSDRAAEIKDYFNAMKKDDALYTFATTCGSWDWVSIIIMICTAFFGSYICLWIVGGIMNIMKRSPEKTEKTEKAE